MRTTGLTFTSLAFTFMLATGCDVAPHDQIAAEDSQGNLIGGFQARDASLNAVGSLSLINQEGESAFFCTGTLIAPSVVLTAKHCAVNISGSFVGMKRVNTNRIFFAVGPDAEKPVKVVEAIAADLAPLDEGGFLGMGSDVAVYHLAQPITEVTPIAVAPGGFKREEVGKRFMAVGFGARDSHQNVTHEGPIERRAGYMTLRAIEGATLPVTFPKFEDFMSALAYRSEALFHDAPRMRAWWERELVDGYEAWLGLSSAMVGADGASDAQGCHGDSGGPIMTTGPKPAILGVVSGGLPSQNLACDHGTYYGTLGPTTREMITKALAYTDPCGKVTTAGSCDGTVAVRCTDKFEGDRRLARIDCADLGMVCSAGSPGKVACVGKDEPVAPSAPTAPTAPAAPTAPTAPMN